MNAVKCNARRLTDDLYTIENVFQKSSYDWPGDWEGRALLAFTSHYEINGFKIPCMDEMMSSIRSHLNEELYFGEVFDGENVNEQQLSGHNWLLRGLLKYAENFDSAEAKEIMTSIVEKLYLPTKEHYKTYPMAPRENGGVSGSIKSKENGWKLSSDVGCAFMCVDALSHYYAYSKAERVKNLLDTIIEVFLSADIVKCGFQTHTTLSCTRGILKLYETTGDKKYLDIAINIVDIYQKFGMTLTYENYNWFGRPESWTEPCAVADSFILSTELYKITKDDKYRTLARRIWFNGLQFCQRSNGGTGPNTCVTESAPVLKISMYEAPFCCTMRYSEGLLEYSKNEELFTWNENVAEETDAYGRHFVDDKLIVYTDGKKRPIFSCRDIPEEEAKKLELRILY